MLAKFSGAKAVRTLSKFNKGKRKCLCCVHLLPKAGAWNKEVLCHSQATTATKWTKQCDEHSKVVVLLI